MVTSAPSPRSTSGRLAGTSQTLLLRFLAEAFFPCLVGWAGPAGPPHLAPALIRYVEERGGSDEPRTRFLAGRGAEVLLKLPLDLEVRSRAAAISSGPLREAAALREQAVRARTLHRPRWVEWAIVMVAMALGLAGLIHALRAVD